MRFIIVVFIIIVAFALLIRLFENNLVYFPFKYPRGHWQPDSFGLRAEDCYFTSSDGVQLHGWFFAKENAIATLLWCHGNAGNISDRLYDLALLDKSKTSINVFIFDYRGYGRSKGSPDEPGIYLDAQAAYDYVASRNDVDKDKIIIFGRSLGGAVAVDLATKRSSIGLILESTFTSAKDMAKSAFGFLPVQYIMKTKLNSIDKITGVEIPVLVTHGTSDRTVPFKLGHQLFETANEPKEFYEIKNADHNDTFIAGGKAYLDRLFEFVNRCVAR